MAEKQTKKQPKRNPAEHLKKHQFKKGKSGNPAGRPKKGSAIAEILNLIGKEIVSVNGMEMTKKEAVMRRVFAEAIKGKMAAIHFIAERTEGKVIDFATQDVQELTDLEYLE